jgi:hypothetical protein
MARDINSIGATNLAEVEALKKLQKALSVEMGKGLSKIQAWDNCWEKVYALAEVHMQGVLDSVLSTQSKL